MMRLLGIFAVLLFVGGIVFGVTELVQHPHALDCPKGQSYQIAYWYPQTTYMGQGQSITTMQPMYECEPDS